MSGFSRLAIAAVLVAGFGGIAQAQSHSLRVPAGADGYYAFVGNGVADRWSEGSGTVPPSESHTVMGLRVPR